MKLLQKNGPDTYSGFRVTGFASRNVRANEESLAYCNCTCNCNATCNSYCVWPESGGYAACYYQVVNNAATGTYAGVRGPI